MMISPILDEDEVEKLLSSFVLKDDIRQDVKEKLRVVLERLRESARSSTKRTKERSLEDALQMLRKIPPPLLQSLKSEHHRHLVQLLLASQQDMVNTSTSACRKLDQMLQHLAQVNEVLVFEEVQQCLRRLLHQEQVLSLKDLQMVCMFLEESVMGREVLRLEFSSLLSKITALLPGIMKEDAAINGVVCYQTVKVCLQMFQLLPEQVVPLVFSEQKDKLDMREILQFLMNIILGEICNRDTRLLAGTAVAMLVSIAPDSETGASSALSLLQVTGTEQCSLTVGQLQVDCCRERYDGVERLSVVRGLLTCLRKDILIQQIKGKQTCLLLDGLFPLVSDLLREKLDYHYYVFQVFILWLKNVKECLAEIRKISGAPFIDEGSDLRDKLTQIIWDNAESPLEGVSESVRTAFTLFLEIYELDCQLSGATRKQLHVDFLHRIAGLPWESRAKYSPLSALLPYMGTDKVLEQYPALPSHIYKCLSTNHLAPCASEIYKLLLQEQRREIMLKDAPSTELYLATQWVQRWQPTVLKALTSDLTLLQNNASSYILPCTLRCFPEAFDTLLAALDPAEPGHLRAWVCIMSAQRANNGRLSWSSDSSSVLETLQLALSSLDDGVRLAAFGLICCSPKSKEAPLEVEYAAVKEFLPFNLNSESSPFRQHLQAGVRKFLVRIRDSCMASLKGQKSKRGLSKEEEKELEQGIGFIDWLAQLPLVSLAPGNSFQRKKTALLLLAAILETCSDSWSPDRKKGQPPANMSELINWARERGKWDFYCRARQLVLIGCLEDATNEIREHAADLLVRFFPPSLDSDVAAALFNRAQRRLQSPRVQEAQTGALMIKLLLQKSGSLDGVLSEVLNQDDMQSIRLIRHLLKSLEQQYLIAKQDMLLAARSAPLHGVVSAVHKCLLDVPGVLAETVDRSMVAEMLSVLEKITLLLLGVLYGDQNTEDKEVPPSFCDMGNAISSLIGHSGAGLDDDGEENVLLSEEHSLVLTCCWVTLKEIGIFLGSLVERILSLTHTDRTLLTVDDLQTASKVFKDIILKCRHWGAVEGCCIGFTKFCTALLTNADPKLREIPNLILQQGLYVLQTPRSTSVTRRAAGLPMLILGVLAAEESSTSHPLLAHSISTLLEAARAPLPQIWDQTLDLPQVCAVHTVQALVKGSSLGLTILQYAPEITMLSLTLLSSPCWAMRNAALQLYSSLCSRMLGQRPASDDISAQYGMSSPAFFKHYPALKPFLQEALERATTDLHEARLSLHPSLYPILTLLAKLQPGAQDQTQALSDFLPPLLQLAASPVYGVRAMSAQALVAMIPPSEYVANILRVVEDVPEKPSSPSCHNRIHGRLLQIKAMLTRALHADIPTPSSLCGVVEAMETRLWLASHEQRCPLVRQAYVAVLRLLRGNCSRAFLTDLGSQLMKELHRTPHPLELGSASFHQSAVHYLCEDPDWAWQVWAQLSSQSLVTRLSLVKWVKEGQGWRGSSLQYELEKALQASLTEALLDQDVEYKAAYLSALVEVMTPDVLSPSQPLLFKLSEAEHHECVQVLLKDLEESRGGPELLSQTLHALSLLISSSTDMSVLQRWCVLLETHRRAEAPEALRLACAQALALTGAALVKSSLMGSTALRSLSTRLISTGVHLLQDQSQQVRSQASKFASVICKSPGGKTPPKCFLIQSSQSLRMLLDLLLGEFWDSEGVLEALVCHLPDWDVRSVLQEAKLTQCSSLYEQDNANMLLEPSVISETVLPYLLCLAKRYPESSVLAKRLEQWEEENAVSVREELGVCAMLRLGDTLGPDWLSVLMEPRFHGAICGLYAKAAFLLHIHSVSTKPRTLFDSSVLGQDLLGLHKWLHLHGVYIPDSFSNAIRIERV